MTQMAVDIFINMNNRRCLWLFDETVYFGGRKTPQGSVGAISCDLANDLYGIKESDEEITPTAILPMVNESPRPANIDHYMGYHKHEIEVLCECPCITDQKLRHHPDYSKPLQVMMLCRKCHAAEHSKIYKQAKAVLITMIAVKMFCKSYPRQRKSQEARRCANL